MSTNDFTKEVISNYQQKCCCALVLDVSGSMAGNSIDELNKGLKRFHEEIQSDQTALSRLEIAIITFNENVNVIQTPKLLDDFTMPTLNADGTTALVDGVLKGIEMVEDRKAWYKSTGQRYYRPWVVLITDGAPDQGQDIDLLSTKIPNDMDNKRYHFYAIGVESANMDVLAKISSPKVPPAKLKGVDFVKFFQWLSASLGEITHSADGQQVNLPKPDEWMDGFKID